MNISIKHPTDRPNFAIVHIGDRALAFSYETVIGFAESFSSWTLIENYWGPTTGKHLNDLNSDKGSRLPAEQFASELAKFLKGIE